MDNLVWAEQQIRELKERVEKLERILDYGDGLARGFEDEKIKRILEEFKVPYRNQDLRNAEKRYETQYGISGRATLLLDGTIMVEPICEHTT